MKNKIIKKVDLVDPFLKSAVKWLEANGGKSTVIGPISIMHYPGDSEYKFSIVIGCLGKRPVKKKEGN